MSVPIPLRLAAWLDKQDMRHIRGAPYRPMTQGKIERWHLTLKNRILLENYYLPGELEARIEAFVAHYNHLRYHESIDNLTPGRRLRRTRSNHPAGKRKDQT
jgi:putative transposase